MSKLVNDIKRGDLANCILLHDFTIMQPDLTNWTEYVVSFFEQHNMVPNRISSPARTSKKNINFNNGIRQLEKMKYQTNDIWIGALPPEHNSDMFCSIFTAFIFLGEKDYNNPLGPFCKLVFDNEIVPFDYIIMNRLAINLAKLTGAKYGYGYQRDFSKTVGYEFGTCSGLKFGDLEAELISKWGRVYRKEGIYKTGDLRDVYGINYLSKAHIERIIKDKRLEDWIQSDSNNGILEQIDKDLWSWQVAPEQISPMREKLRDTGMILCC